MNKNNSDLKTFNLENYRREIFVVLGLAKISKTPRYDSSKNHDKSRLEYKIKTALQKTLK